MQGRNGTRDGLVHCALGKEVMQNSMFTALGDELTIEGDAVARSRAGAQRFVELRELLSRAYGWRSGNGRVSATGMCKVAALVGSGP